MIVRIVLSLGVGGHGEVGQRHEGREEGGLSRGAERQDHYPRGGTPQAAHGPGGGSAEGRHPRGF